MGFPILIRCHLYWTGALNTEPVLTCCWQFFQQKFMIYIWKFIEWRAQKDFTDIFDTKIFMTLVWLVITCYPGAVCYVPSMLWITTFIILGTCTLPDRGHINSLRAGQNGQYFCQDITFGTTAGFYTKGRPLVKSNLICPSDKLSWQPGCPVLNINIQGNFCISQRKGSSDNLPENLV